MTRARGSSRTVRVALLCDVDQTVYHVGDEAIGLAGADRLRRRGLDVVMVSRQEKYGPDGAPPARCIPALTFPWPERDRERYLDEICRVLAGESGALPPEDKLFGIIERYRDVDALVIGGGGALNSRYGWLLAERAATAMVAASQGARVVLSGQSIGPDLSVTDAEALGELLDLCSLVGLRDAGSLARARAIRPDHPALVETVDDAVGLPLSWAEPLEDRVSVTLGSDPWPFPVEDYVQVMAAALDGLADRTGAEVEFVPHMADPDTGGSDVSLHERVAAAMGTPSTLAPLERADRAAARQARSRWIVSTRFHPVVFGTLAASSVLAVPLDRYGASRLDGALRHAGMTHASVPFAALWDPATGGATAVLDAALDALVAARPAEHARLTARRDELLACSERWWDAVAAAVTGEEAPDPDPGAAALGADARFDAPLRALLAPFSPQEQAGRHDEPTVAVVMRTKDRPVMLDRAVRDVLSQTRADWQLVIVDDAGDAEAVDAVVARYAHESFGRIGVLHRAESTGMEAASNAGITATASELLCIHDDDDTWHPTFLQRTVEHLRRHPEESAVVVRTEIVHEHQEGTTLVEDERFLSWPRLHAMRLADFMTVNRTTPIAVVHRRRVHDELGLFREDLPAVGDYEFHLRLLQHGAVGFLDLPLARWHLRPSAAGADSNSMFAMDDAHHDVDLTLADAYFREWVGEHGIGLPMFISRTVGEQVDRATEGLARTHDELLARLDAVSGQLAEVGARLAALEDESRHHGARLEERSAVQLARRGARSARSALYRAAGALRRT
ncbi:glycosyltransferase [Brachybacterium huguangmaarense]|uniref:Glycosyltransferase n=1 Tax=Brachybacterium huguangmaarense TaxID=1652028 RepID=A0ABY6G1A2_9MICO|nr:glycosyltransferase [Brachybacterium huguangmaarense]UYG16968.1 glycosyltransferase [Brachybacterium huguangmaarense]